MYTFTVLCSHFYSIYNNQWKKWNWKQYRKILQQNRKPTIHQSSFSFLFLLHRKRAGHTHSGAVYHVHPLWICVTVSVCYLKEKKNWTFKTSDTKGMKVTKKSINDKEKTNTSCNQKQLKKKENKTHEQFSYKWIKTINKRQKIRLQQITTTQNKRTQYFKS